MKYTTFDTLISDVNLISTKKVGIVSHAGGNHIGIYHIGQSFPISVNESEFNFMQKLIVENNLKCGFELSTGTGISTIGCGMGFKETGGVLTSMDSYYEETTQLSTNIPVGNYSEEDIRRIKEISPSYLFTKDIITHYSLPVDLVVGWSPTDIPKYVTSALDFVFLDCPKSDNEFNRDITAIYPLLNQEKFIICVHDTHTFTKKSEHFIKEKLGLEMMYVHDYYPNSAHQLHRTYPLGIIKTENIIL